MWPITCSHWFPYAELFTFCNNAWHISKPFGHVASRWYRLLNQLLDALQLQLIHTLWLRPSHNIYWRDFVVVPTGIFCTHQLHQRKIVCLWLIVIWFCIYCVTSVKISRCPAFISTVALEIVLRPFLMSSFFFFLQIDLLCLFENLKCQPSQLNGQVVFAVQFHVCTHFFELLFTY